MCRNINEIMRQMSYEAKLYKKACDVIDELADYSDKNLTAQRRNNHVRYYITWRKEGVLCREYVNQSKIEEATCIKTLKYAEQIKKNIEYNQRQNSNYVKYYRPVSHSDVSKQLAPVYRSDCDEVMKLFYSNEAVRWMQEKKLYKSTIKPHRPEELKHKTISGENTRSKSEMNLYNWLLCNDIPFVYELPLRLPDGTMLLPDFTIYIDENRVVYIEHDGMYYDSWKKKDTNKKIDDYFRNGLIMGRDVLFTFDDCNKSLDMKSITLQIMSFIANQYLY